MAQKSRPVVKKSTSSVQKSRPVARKSTVRRVLRAVKRRFVPSPKRVVRHAAYSGSLRGAGAVVAYAYAQLGKPYVMGAAGPGAFDCSGLTMRAYARIGVYLAHRAAAQSGRSVSRSQARPGDLVKWGSHHVGIYVGGGYVIHAPKPGDRVRKARLWGSYRIVRPG